MIKSLTAKMFRKHEDLVLNFTTGLNVIRGPNEIGKTTIIEIVLYAVYGSAALRKDDTLADAVTWGHKESELKAGAVLCMHDIDYTFTRGKSGAECNYMLDGKALKVTGQREVTAFAAELLGADVKTASNLMLATASGLRGALDEGPTAVSALMGKLADFDIIDRILQTADRTLLVGNSGPFEAKLAAAEADVAAMRTAIAETNAAAAVAEIDATVEAHVAVQRALDLQAVEAQDAQVKADEAVQRANAHHADYNTACRRESDATTAVAQEKVRLDVAVLEAGRKPDEGRIAALRKQINDAEGHDARLAAYTSFKLLPNYPDAYWEGSREAFDVEVQAISAKKQLAERSLIEIGSSIKSMRASLITSGKCPTCGHAAHSEQHIAEKNAVTVDAILKLEGQFDFMSKVVSGHQNDLSALGMVSGGMYAKTLNQNLPKFASNVKLSDDCFPPRAQWVGDVPAKTITHASVLKRDLEGLLADERSAIQAEGRVTAHRAAIVRLEAELAASKAASAALMPLPDIEPLVAAYDEAYKVYAAITSQSRALVTEITLLNQNKAEIERRAREVLHQLTTAEVRVIEYQADLKKLAFNNGLIKTLRGLKPTITDHLWNQTLAAVSTFFSQMRGEQSVVTKDVAGFKVNGQKVSSFSESTLDVLALAIRVALSKTFLPSVPFMSLDEPASGCDNDRTGNMLGFLSSMGITQTLLASHDELSESVAANVIALGA